MRLLREEGTRLVEATRRFHGDTLLWIGCHQDVTRNVRGCMIRNRLYASEAPRFTDPGSEEVSSLCCIPEALPLRNNSLDAMVLHHALEVARDPRGVLREAARVMAPGGRLVICTFNPLSLWGLRRVYARIRPDSFSGLRLLPGFRLLDWLALLGFELQDPPEYLCYGMPFQREAEPVSGSSVQRLLARHQLPFGGVYLLSAVKQTMALRPPWRAVPVPKLAPSAFPNSAVNKTGPRARVLQLRDWKSIDRPG